MVPRGPALLPTLFSQLARNVSGEAGVGLGDGTGLGEGMGVGVGLGCILLETEPHPARNSKSPVKSIEGTVRTQTSLGSWLSFKKGNLFDK
jgi:hypothetical protein